MTFMLCYYQSSITDKAEIRDYAMSKLSFHAPLFDEGMHCRACGKLEPLKLN
jgi:hypothetical protein